MTDIAQPDTVTLADIPKEATLTDLYSVFVPKIASDVNPVILR